jgi:hypothetical protein
VEYESRSKKRAKDFTRERKITFIELIYFMLGMVKERKSIVEHPFGTMNLLAQRGRQLARYLVSVGLNFVELGSFAEQNSMRWQVRSGKEIYNIVWFNTKFL